jgi:hypothetical protein
MDPTANTRTQTEEGREGTVRPKATELPEDGHVKGRL